MKAATSVDVPPELLPYIIVRNNANGWLTSDLIEDYLERIILNLSLPSDTRLVLVMDKARIHQTQGVLSKLKIWKRYIILFYSKWLYFLGTAT